EGGVAFNVVPARGRLTFSLRPPPGADMVALRGEIDALVRAAGEADKAKIEWRAKLDNVAFATRELESFPPLLGDRVDDAIDMAFWTEAALLQEAGVDAVVLGPGDISQAHAADESVPLD